MAIQKTPSNSLKVFVASALIAGLLSFLFGSIANNILHDGLRCGGVGAIGGCDNSFVFGLGFYFGFLFCLSAAHIGFVQWKHPYYFASIALLLLVSLIDREILKLALGFTAAGIILGIIIAQIRKMCTPQKR